MFFEIGTKTPDSKFSYIIVKHPDNIFERSEGGRKITCKFSEDKTKYIGYVETNSLDFLQTARNMNMSNYLHVQQSAVCPFNLKMFSTVFRSALSGNPKTSNMSEDDYYKPKSLVAIIGPYPCRFSDILAAFNSIGFKVNRMDGNTLASMINIETIEDISVTEFLQKIYLISFYLTSRFNMVKTQEQQIDMFAKLCSSWLDKCSIRNSIVNRLCKRIKSFVKKFEEKIAEETIEDKNEIDKRKEEIENFLSKKSFHDIKHKTIIDIIPDNCENLIDLGCGEGKFIVNLLKNKPNISSVIGIDASPIKIEKCKRKIHYNKKVTLIHGNFMYSKIEENKLSPDFLTAIEIIEHLYENGRNQLIDMIYNYYQPKEFILTTPNKEFNKNFGLEENELRHNDHKIEYTLEEFQKEVIDKFSSTYETKIIPLFGDESPESLKSSEISFVLYGKRKEGKKTTKPLFRDIYTIPESFYLPYTNYRISPKEIKSGLSSRAMLNNPEKIFYMAPSISPVQYSDENPKFIEHPDEAYNYYHSHKVRWICSENKYMGSRGYVLVFKNIDIAKAFGFTKPIIINSRQGYKFFDNKIEDDIYKDISKKVSDLNYDFIMLDCEILPWKLKAENLDFQFIYPGECLYLSRKYGKYGNIKNTEEFLKTLSCFTKDSELEIRMFQLLAVGSVKSINPLRLINTTNCLFMNRIDMYEILRKLEGDIFKPVEGNIIDVFDNISRDRCTNRWIDYCNNSGEGFVFKPLDSSFLFSSKGSLIQPSLKVRGFEYLRMVYGIDYLEPEIFNFLKIRKVKSKMTEAIREFELSSMIIQAFIKNRNDMLLKYVSGFIGMENASSVFIDATL